MRKLAVITLVLTLMVMLFPTSIKAQSATNVDVLLDGYKMSFDVPPRIDENNRVLIPVRFVSEALGAKVHYEKDTVIITQEDKEVVLVIGSNIAEVNGSEIRFDTKAIVDRGRTLVPLRFVSEALGQSVEWDGINRYVWIGEKIVPLMEEVARTATFEEFLPLYGNDDYRISTFDYYKDIQVFSQLPVRFTGSSTDTALYNIWFDKEEQVIKVHYDGRHFNIHFLADDQIPRGRSNVDWMRVENPDGSFIASFPIHQFSDNYRLNIENWDSFKPSDIRYIGFSVDTYSMPLYEPNFK